MRTFLCLFLSASLALANPLILLSGSGGTAAIPLKTNLVAYYQLDEAAASNAIDAHTGGKTFTQASSPPSVAGVISTARSLNTTSTVFTRADDVAFSPGASQFFITMWVKPSTLTQSSFPTIFGKAGATNTTEWQILFQDTNNNPSLGVTANGSTGVFCEPTAPNNFTTGAFLFIACGWDGANLKMSVNGGAFVNEPFAGPLFDGTEIIQIGFRPGGTAFAGAIDEIAFWKDRCLTLSEVQSIYNAGAGLPFSSW